MSKKIICDSLIIGDRMKNVVDKIKKFFSKKNNLITSVIILVIIIIVIVVAIIFKNNHRRRFAINEIYNVYPEEVRELYSNIVSVSCHGDLYLDINLDNGKIDVSEMSSNNLIDYLFSHLDKQNLLTDQISISTINEYATKLFNMKSNFRNELNNYQYGDYLYQIKDNKLTREKKECVSDKQYLTHLYGYSYNINELSIDVNIGYLSDGILYDLADNRLGEYSGDVKELDNLFVENSYYRFNYVYVNKTYKLSSVEWNSRS